MSKKECFNKIVMKFFEKKIEDAAAKLDGLGSFERAGATSGEILKHIKTVSGMPDLGVSDVDDYMHWNVNQRGPRVLVVQKYAVVNRLKANGLSIPGEWANYDVLYYSANVPAEAAWIRELHDDYALIRQEDYNRKFRKKPYVVCCDFGTQAR